MIRGAYFSRCGTYRYALWRLWGADRIAIDGVNFPRNGYVMWIGLNPSTADATQDDPTIRRCIGFTKAWGYDGMFMCNLFAYRATNPDDMLAQYEPRDDGQRCVGEYTKFSLAAVGGCKNAQVIYHLQKKCAIVIACWGGSREMLVRNNAARMSNLFVAERPIDRDLHCLGLTEDFSPRHPLYMKSGTSPVLYKESWNTRIKKVADIGASTTYSDMGNTPLSDMVKRGRPQGDEEFFYELNSGQIVEP